MPPEVPNPPIEASTTTFNAGSVDEKVNWPPDGDLTSKTTRLGGAAFTVIVKLRSVTLSETSRAS